MYIVLKICEGDKNLMDELCEKGVDAWLVRNGVLIEPEETDEGFIVPNALIKSGLAFRPYVVVSEEGGGTGREGHARIVAGRNGKCLAPFFIPFRQIFNKEHAFFSLAVFSLIEVTRSGEAGACNAFVEMSDVFQQRKGRFIRIAEKGVWKGMKEDLPETFGRFGSAVEAGCEKAQCFHCRHVHFAISRDSVLPRPRLVTARSESAKGDTSGNRGCEETSSLTQ